jgi:hypothetical protein
VAFQAELGFQAWWRQHCDHLDGNRQQAIHLAEALTAAVVALVLASTGALAAAHAGRDRVVVDHLAGASRPARLQALASAPTTTAAPPAAASGAPLAATAAAGAATGAAHPPASAPAPPPPRTIPANRGALPVGKGMWIWQPDRTEGGNAAAIVARAKATGLTHLYVRTGDYKKGFIGGDFLNRILPAAHAAGLRVYAWDFPYLDNVGADVNQALAAITYRTPDGHRVDGFVADIESTSEKVNINPGTATAYGNGLRRAVGPDYPLIACVPRPNPRLVNYPFAEVVAPFDAIAPMVYWMHDDPALAITDVMARLAPFGKPVIPVGQAYDGGPEGGPPGVPPRAQLLEFMQAADQAGAVGVSWWSWQHADQQAWDAVRDAPQFLLPPSPAVEPGQIRAYQTLLTSLGFPAARTGVWDPATIAAVQAYQRAARLPVSGIVDDETRATLFTPFPPPIRPQP